MASAVCSEPSRISISLEGTASASPFPSPSSSFLPPPTPGAHEFAVKPVPPARNGRKSSNGNTASHPPSPLPPSQPTVVSEVDIAHGDAVPLVSTVDVSALTASSESNPQKMSSQRSSLNGGAEQPRLNGMSQSPLVSKESSTSSNMNGNGSVPLPPLSPGLISPMTPTPSSIQRQIMPKESLEPRSPSNFDQPNSSSTTPTIPNAALPPENGNLKVNGVLSSTETITTSQTTNPPSSSGSSSGTTTITSTSSLVEQEPSLSKIIIPDGLIDAATPSSGLSSPMFPPNSTSSIGKARPISTISTSSTSADPSLFSNRPAPPSPAMSRRVSGCPSLGSSSARSRPSSTVVSRTNSLRKSTHSTTSTSPVINPHRQSVGSQLNQTFFAPLPSPQNLTFALNVQPAATPAATAAGSSSSSSNQPSGSVSPTGVSTPSSGSFLVSTSVSTVQSVSSSTSLPTTPVNLTTPTPGAAFTTTTTTTTTTNSSRRTSTIVYIKIRDFGFPSSDERHIGLGPDVPKANKVGRMNRRLGGKRPMSQGSMSSSDGDGMEEEDEEEDEDGDGWLFGGGGGARGFGGFGFGGGGYAGGGGFSALGRFNWSSGATAADIFETEKATAAAAERAAGGGGGGFPSRTELDRNFLDGDGEPGLDEDEYFDAEGEEEGEDEDEDTLYPGLYRALYAFEPEGTAEMRLVEDQIVRVVGRGGGVGWAVVVDDSCERTLDGGAATVNGNAQVKHALVPESYLEPVRLDWEDEESAAAAT